MAVTSARRERLTGTVITSSANVRQMLELDYPVDLVNLDRQEAFALYLEEEGELLEIG